MESEVRAATVEDAHRIAEIHVAGWRAAYRGHMTDEFLADLSVEKRAETRRRGIAEPPSADHRTWIVLEDGRTEGFAITGPTRDADAPAGTFELYAIYLDPPRWSQGLGRALLEHAVADLRSRRVETATLWVLEGNARARRFYEIAGWTTDGTAKVEHVGGRELPHVRYRVAWPREGPARA